MGQLLSEPALSPTNWIDLISDYYFDSNENFHWTTLCRSTFCLTKHTLASTKAWFDPFHLEEIFFRHARLPKPNCTTWGLSKSLQSGSLLIKGVVNERDIRTSASVQGHCIHWSAKAQQRKMMEIQLICFRRLAWAKLLNVASKNQYQ